MVRRYRNKRGVSRKRSKLGLLIPLGVIVAAVVVLGILELTHTIHLFSKSKPASEVIVTSGNPTPAPTKDSSENKATSKSASSSTSSTRNISGATDTNGTATATTNSKQWVTSASGAITVKQPIGNATFQSGGTLSGSATVPQVDYTLIDNSTGVISEGTLNVVNGNFSGNIQFASQSSSGRLDVYSTSTPGGPEQNLIEITVYF